MNTGAHEQAGPIAFLADRQTVIAGFCRRNGIVKLSVFGSALRDDFRAESDIDVLVEFAPGERVGLIRLAGMEQELSAILGRRADMRTEADLSRYFREEVIVEAQVQYVAD